VVKPLADGSSIRVTIRTLPDWPIEIITSRTEGGCGARAKAKISGADAWLERVYVQLKWPVGVSYARMSGVRVADGVSVSEIAHP
jgi:hypothetical protein